MNLMIFVSVDVQTASQMAEALKTLQQQQDLRLQDAAISVRLADGSNRMWACQELVGDGRLGGMFWGVLFALIYWSRFWGLNIGSIVDDYGIDDQFIKDISLKMTVGHSALSLIAAEEALEPVTLALKAFDAQVFTYALSQAAEGKLNTIFASGQ
jgi:uncharacterized membrane protein